MMPSKKPMTMKMAKPTKKSSFKPCPGCPSPAACKISGKCAKKQMQGK